MDRILYFILILIVVGYFLIPKIAEFEPAQLYWQWQLDKFKANFHDYKESGRLSKYLPKNMPFTPQGAADFYKNAIMDQLKTLDSLEIK